MRRLNIATIFFICMVFAYFRIGLSQNRHGHRKGRRFLICCTYGFTLRCNSVSEIFVCGFLWCHGCSALELSTHCELKTECMPYTVRMNKIKEQGSPDLNSEAVLGKRYAYASISVTDFFFFRAAIFLSSLTFDGYLCSVSMSVDCLTKMCVFP